MSRKLWSPGPHIVNSKGEIEEPPTKIIYGDDLFIGQFLQIRDIRFAGTKTDNQGEGYLFDWDEATGVTINLIGLETGDGSDSILTKVEMYLKSIGVIA